MAHYGGRPNYGHNPAPSPDISFTARDAFSYIIALPLAALAALFFFNFTLDIARSILGAFMPYSLALLGSYVWVVVASLASLFAAKSILANICQALGVRLKLGILNMFKG